MAFHFYTPMCFVVIISSGLVELTHWGRVSHICIGKLTNIGSYNGLSPGRCQAIIWTNAGILLIGPWGTKFSEILIGFHTFSFKKIHLKMSSGKWWSFCPGLNVLMWWKPICYRIALLVLEQLYDFPIHKTIEIDIVCTAVHTQNGVSMILLNCQLTIMIKYKNISWYL